ncbi:hypothetical protein [Lactiplantibacillus daowaiensis]|uniref:Uncharacterized protein n=1 Tax=Lactiplantibacillus daowaiensis TaxID=2559918 RepID=A0ABW1S317_9LACO
MTACFYFDYIKATVRLNTQKKLMLEMTNVPVSLAELHSQSVDSQVWQAVCVAYQQWVATLPTTKLQEQSLLTSLFKSDDREALPADTVIDVLPGFGDHPERLRVFSLIKDLGAHAETDSYLVSVSVRRFTDSLPSELQNKPATTVTYKCF